MTTPVSVVKDAYAAFSRGDVPGILKVVADDVDWELIAPAGLPYAGRRRNHADVSAFFAQVAAADAIEAFEPHEFIEAGDHVTVLGWERATTQDEHKRNFASEWVHLFTVKNGKITRWRGFFDTAARYGH